MPHRRTSLFAAAATAAVSVVSAVAALAPAPAAAAAPIPLAQHRAPEGLPPLPFGPRSADHLTVTVRHSGSPLTDGTFELYCHPDGGTHRSAKDACDKLDGMSRWGEDPFAAVPRNAQCTMMYGGPATAHVTGTWAGRPIDADFSRTNGCEIHRWGRFVPVLPATSS
ncbi:SSI family serine proteinase inhibitor [Streptomyces sp. NPDC048248]|uniref:SSI family serine proteinase inhibitor n=1 Tax=Streptomyces sp. NPDC048248 TaxID=3365523 RepID=UPI003718F5D6